MTDSKTATERVCELLDEFEHECFMIRVEASETRAKDEVVRKAYERQRDETAQAIATTLGKQTWRDSYDQKRYDRWYNSLFHGEPSSFKELIEDVIWTTETVDLGPNGNECQGVDEGEVNTDSLIKVWAEKAATLGSGMLTAERVRWAFEKRFDFNVWVPPARWQAIADELNAELGSEINGETSDGYHTFNELYHHRAVLFSVIVRDHREIAWKARKHHDGTMYDGMFIVGVDTPSGQATYHYDVEPYWDMFDCKELERAPEWDGHTSDDAIARIATLGSGECELREASWDNGQCTWGVICSACGAKHEHTHGYGWNFCPTCGKAVKR